MNGTDRLERELTTWFAETALPQTPDWTSDILAATGTMRQRPRWSFPTRWLPASVIPRLPRLTRQTVPWRTIALLGALVLLLAAAVALYVGSRPRLPAPFGPAANGLVAYAEHGEIWTVDPVTGDRKKIVTPVRRQRCPSLLAGWDAPRVLAGGNRRAIARDHERRRQWPGRVEGRAASSTPIPTRSPGRRTVAGRGQPGRRGRGRLRAADDLPRRYDHRQGPGPRHPGRRYGGVLAPARRAPTHVHDRDTGGRRRLRSSSPSRAGRRIRDGRRGIRRSTLRPGGWTPDGKYFVVHRHDQTNDRAWTELLDPDTGSDEPAEVAFGRVSNDGKQLVGHRDFRWRSAPSASCLSRMATASRLQTPRSRPISSTTQGCSGRPTIDGSSCTHRTRALAGSSSTPRADRRSHRSGRSEASNRGSARRRDGAAAIHRGPRSVSAAGGAHGVTVGSAPPASAYRPAFHDRGDSDG